jgi:hypothetical protein
MIKVAIYELREYIVGAQRWKNVCPSMSLLTQ